MSNKYKGSWKEPKCEKITLSFSKENLEILLTNKIQKKSQYTDQQICNWCDSYFMYLTMNTVSMDGDTIRDTVFDITIQYEMFLGNTYSVEELQKLDFTKIELPKEWYKDWLEQLTTKISKKDK